MYFCSQAERDARIAIRSISAEVLAGPLSLETLERIHSYVCDLSHTVIVGLDNGVGHSNRMTIKSDIRKAVEDEIRRIRCGQPCGYRV